MKRAFITAAWFAAGLAAAILQPSNANAQDAEAVKRIFAQHLPNAPGAYVLTGEIRSQISDGQPAKVYKAGEFFFEPPGGGHLASENASATEPASLLAVFVAADNAALTAPGVK